MKLAFVKNIYSHPELTTENYAALAEAHEVLTFKKGYIFLESGKIANEYYLIKTGLVRAFVVDFNGNEITTEFYGSGEILIEVSSLFQRIPTSENLVAITDGEALKIDFDLFQTLYHKLPAFNEWGRAWMSNELFKSKQRRIEMLTKSAGERYLDILHDKPELIKYAPLKQIASYLGITDTSLSRIRKEVFTE